jgi:hypothetical protein
MLRHNRYEAHGSTMMRQRRCSQTSEHTTSCQPIRHESWHFLSHGCDPKYIEDQEGDQPCNRGPSCFWAASPTLVKLIPGDRLTWTEEYRSDIWPATVGDEVGWKISSHSTLVLRESLISRAILVRRIASKKSSNSKSWKSKAKVNPSRHARIA